jgi:hypothetical protein
MVEINHEVNAMREEHERVRKTEIMVSDSIYANSRFNLDKMTLHMKELFRGPVKVKVTHGKIELEPLKFVPK